MHQSVKLKHKKWKTQQLDTKSLPHAQGGLFSILANFSLVDITHYLGITLVSTPFNDRMSNRDLNAD
jgi:hypothetical protein